MNRNTSNHTASESKKKLIAVGLLVILFVVVAWQNLPKSDARFADSPSTQAASEKLPTEPLAGSAALSVLTERLPQVELKQLLAHNPFRLISTDLSGAEGPSVNSLDEANEAGDTETNLTETLAADAAAVFQINAILYGSQKPAVLIGQRLYYEQDIVADGWKVVAINPDRVLIEQTPQ